MKQDNILKEIEQNLSNAPDLTVRELSNATILFFDSITDSKTINYILRNIAHLNKRQTKKLIDHVPHNTVEMINESDIVNKLNNGFMIVITNYNIIACDVKGELTRAIAEPTTEPVVNGPKDAFVENIMMNLGLIKRRIKTNSLRAIDVEVGVHTETTVKVLYVEDIAKKKYVDKIVNKLNKIDIDGIFDSGYIKNYLEDSSTFPTILSTEHPDLTAASLLEGKIVIMVDNSPFVLISPSFFVDFLHSADDYTQKGLNVSLTRVFRTLAFIISVVMPGVYIAISAFNHSSIPAPLMLNILIQRIAVPIPSIFEGLMMLIFFEILREGDLRMPAKIGASISIVGALILGDAAVSAGITSPIMVIIIAITAICSSVFNSTDMLNAIRWWRITILLFAAVSGLVGVYLGVILLLARICSLKSNGVPYLTPMAPASIEGLKDSFILLPKNKRRKRSSLLSDNLIRER